ncbi:MAG TPA: DNA polymerase IV [Bacillota bacterium]|nr:DNA polymerase IV [Bacillota bacterium]
MTVVERWYPKKGRIILHIDMNCFYASVEMTTRPELKGKPVAIAGNPEQRKGIIVTSSYEARAKGVKTTMPLWEAKKLCPHLIVLRPNFDKYREASKNVFQLLREYTPIIEPISIDEGYLDITDCKHLGHPVEIAHNIQKDLLEKLDLPCSIGIGPNKFLAKTASDMKKPLGITILRKRDLAEKLWPLSVKEMHGVGAKTAERLERLNIHTIADLANADTYELNHFLGINGERLNNRANGIDPRKVDPDSVHEYKSIGNSRTLPKDTTNKEEIFSLIEFLSQTVSERLRRRELAGISIQLMIRYANRETVTRSKKLYKYIDAYDDIVKEAKELFHVHWNEEPIRLLGVSIQDIEEKQYIAEQLNLFNYKDVNRADNLERVVQKLSAKYGEETIKYLRKDKAEKPEFRTSFQKDFLDDYLK